MQNKPQPTPLTIRAKGLAKLLGVSERHIHRLAAHSDPAARLPASFKIGGATVWRHADIVEWLDAQAARRAA